MKAIEITYNAVQDTYHPHIHAIFAVRPSYFKTGYLTRKAWRDLWQAVMQLDYSPQVDVRAISGREKAVAEMAKYPVKTADLLTLDSIPQRSRCLRCTVPCTGGGSLPSAGSSAKLPVNCGSMTWKTAT